MYHQKPLPWPLAAAAQKTYLPPFLSPHSLEMCTESLGSETGSGIDELPYFYHHHHHHSLTQTPVQPAPAKPIKKVKCKTERSFPPPLTSTGGVRVQSHREGGRLVMKAVTFPSSSSGCFQAERGNGRLRLSLVCGNEEEVDGGGGVGGPVSAEWSSSRCNGDVSRVQSWPFCVAIS